MIYTLTLNPAIDYTVFLNSLVPGHINRSRGEKISWGGKGINVSRILGVFGVENVALGLIAGFTGRALAEGLAAEKMKSDFVELAEGNTRINVKIESRQETEINGGGPKVSAAEFDLLLKKLKALSPSDMIVLSGSAPAAVTPDMYEELLRTISGSGIKFVADVSGKALSAAVRVRPCLIKPNREELAALCGRDLPGEADVRKAAMDIAAQGVTYVLVSMGAAGALMATSDGSCFTVQAPCGEVHSTVGAGDALLAGFLSAYNLFDDKMDTLKLQYALKMGVAAGSAAAFSDPEETPALSFIKTLLEKIR